MAKGIKKVFVLNVDNPRDNTILEVLNTQYNYAEFVRNVLYEYINNNNLHHGNDMATIVPHDKYDMNIVLPRNDNCITTSLPLNDNTMTTPLPLNDNAHNSNFLIDLDNIPDADAEINASAKEDPTQNALDFLKRF